MERPPSPVESEYSLDLGALDMDTVSDMDVPKQKVDRIFSEDIDGPSDFTQNMELWMRGGTAPRKGTLKGKKHASNVFQEIREEEQQDVQENHYVHTQSHQLKSQETEHIETVDEANKSPSRDEGTHAEGDDTRVDQFSEWNAYGSASTPAPPVHRDFLQPSVEEYHSELTPRRHMRQFSERSLRSQKLAPSPLIQKESLHESTPGRASSPTLSPARSPVLYRTTTNQTSNTDYQEASRQELEKQMKQMQANFQQLESLNEALGSALDEERRMRKQDKTTHDAQLTEVERRERDLKDMKEAVYNQQDDFRREFAELKENLRKQQDPAEASKVDHGQSQQDLNKELQRLREELGVQKLEHKEKISSLEHDLDLARRGREHAEETSRIHRAGLEDQRKVHESETGRLRAELQQAYKKQAVDVDLKTRLEHAVAEIEQLRNARNESEHPSVILRDQLTKAKSAHTEQTTRLSAERIRAVEMAADFQQQLQGLRQQLKMEQASHEAELNALRTSQQSSSRTSVQELDVIRAELNAKQSELNEAILERDEARDSLQLRQTVETKLQDELADIRAANAELDARISERILKRDAFWRVKLDEADRERQLMAKALLHQWGREEVGIDSPQLYAYKYLEKQTSGPKSPSKKKAAA